MKVVKTYEEFIGDLKNKYDKAKREKGDEEVYSVDTNQTGRHYDQEDDGTDQLSRNLMNKFS